MGAEGLEVKPESSTSGPRGKGRHLLSGLWSWMRDTGEDGEECFWCKGVSAGCLQEVRGPRGGGV